MPYHPAPHDSRLPSNELSMTQELIANMLGVRREGVTEAARKLQKAGLIHYSRGKITVLDRRGLEARVCECYPVVKRELDRLLPEESEPSSWPFEDHPDTAGSTASRCVLRRKLCQVCVAEQSQQSEDDQIGRNDVAQQSGHDQNEHAGDQR